MLYANIQIRLLINQLAKPLYIKLFGNDCRNNTYNTNSNHKVALWISNINNKRKHFELSDIYKQKACDCNVIFHPGLTSIKSDFYTQQSAWEARPLSQLLQL